MVVNYRVFQTQRAQESPPVQGMQGLPQRRVWDINYEYLRSPVFFIKLAEMVGASSTKIVSEIHFYVFLVS